MLHLAEQILGRLGRDPAMLVGAGDLPGPREEPEQLCVVVQHLLEVGDVPGGVGRVAGESTAELVVDPATRHAVEGGRHHRESIGRSPHGLAQAELEGHRLRELGSPAEPAPSCVERLSERGHRVLQQLGGQRFSRLREPLRAADRLGHPARLLHDLVAPIGPRLRDAFQHLAEGGHAVGGLLRVVRAGEEGAAVWGEERRQGPPPVTVHRLHGVHVDAVDVGPLLAVDLDRYEPFVHEGRRRLILEGLTLHHVTPVAGRVADRQEDRSALGSSTLQRLLAPWVPIHGVAGVLQQIGAGLVRQPIACSLAHGSQCLATSGGASALPMDG